MDFKNTFTSVRLMFEPVDPKDEATKAFLYEYTIRDLDVFGYAVHDTLMPLTKSSSDQWVESFEKNLLSVIISLKPENGILPSGNGLRGTPIGCMAISPIQMRSLHHRRGDLGISIASAYQNKGYGTEALKWLASWAWQLALSAFTDDEHE